MPRVRFDGPAHRLIVADKKPIPRGGFATFTAEELEQLQAQKNIRLTVIHTPRREPPQEPEAREGEGQPTASTDQKE
jgi:hypothetical protein